MWNLKNNMRSSHCGSAVMNLMSNCEDVDSVPGLTQGLRHWHCCELWCRSQTWLRSPIAAVAVAYTGKYRSDLTPSLGTFICCRCDPKKQ